MYKAMKAINGLYIVADSKTCKPLTAKTYSIKANAEKAAKKANTKK